MLKLAGRNADGENLTSSDTEFLMQQMMLRESLEEARDADDPMEELDKLLEKITQLINEQIARIAVMLDSGTEEDLDIAMECIYKMQFLKKLYSEAEALESELEDFS
jgi:molecular chaperone HscB